MKEQKELWFDPLPTIQAFELVEVFTICGSLAKMVAARVEDIPDYLLQHFIDAEGHRWQHDGAGYYKLGAGWQSSLTERERRKLLHGVWQL